MSVVKMNGSKSPLVINGLRGEYAEVNGIKMFYMHGGGDKKKPLVLVHGLFQTGAGHSRATQATGHKKCVMLSHDRGARIARTFAMDYPEMLLGVCFMDMLPTEYIYQEMTCTETGTHHWDQLFKLASPMAEDLLDEHPDNIKTYVNNFYERTPGFINILKEDGVYDYYMECILAPGAMMAMLNDYRAAYYIDVPRIREALDKGERISVPVQLLWGSKGNASKSPIMDIYRARCSRAVKGAVVPSGHYLAEEQPEITQDLLLKFADDCFFLSP